MMDYYSSYPMPSEDVRITSMLEYTKTIPESTKYTSDQILQIVTSIVKTTNEYSYADYAVYGIIEEKTQIRNTLQNPN